MTIIWQTTRQICPGCGGLTEEGRGDHVLLAERCPRCRWEVGVPDWRPRPFGLNDWRLTMENLKHTGAG